MAIVAVYENDEERDRKTCIALDQKATASQRELAEWILDHPRYPGRRIAEWLQCGETRVRQLRQWANEGFVGLPHSRKKRSARAGAQGALKSLSDSEIPTEEEADESWQNDLYDQACLLLERMADETRQRFFAEIRRLYSYGKN